MSTAAVSTNRPEIVPHPQGGYTRAEPVPGTTIRIYRGWWSRPPRRRKPQPAPQP